MIGPHATRGTSGNSASVDGVRSGINFGTGLWGAGDYFGLGQSGWFWDNSSENRSFTLPAGKRLKSLNLSSSFSSSTWKISDGVNPDVSGTFASADTPITVTTGWTAPGPNVTITFSARWDSGIGDIRYGE